MKLTKYELSNVTKFVDNEVKAAKLEALGYKRVEESTIEEVEEIEKEVKKETKKKATKGE